MSFPSGFHLLPGEKILWKGKMSWRSLWAPILIGILSIWIYGLGIIFIAYAASKWARIYYIVTNRRVTKVVEHYAFLRTDTFEIENGEVKDMQVVRTAMGEKLDFGDIVIISDTEKIIFNGISHPYEELGRVNGMI